MDETGKFEVMVEERYKYVGHQLDGPRSIGKYKTKEEAVRAGLGFQMDHQDYEFRVVCNGKDLVCQPAPNQS